MKLQYDSYVDNSVVLKTIIGLLNVFDDTAQVFALTLVIQFNR